MAVVPVSLGDPLMAMEHKIDVRGKVGEDWHEADLCQREIASNLRMRHRAKDNHIQCDGYEGGEI